ncbi:hypothetical protein BJX61DRAFT_549940 [Aspergillus egyptiacus]|nr:hypothetical protein BJX61DRAFT_549940 [Aspergillus egyptiacus]
MACLTTINSCTLILPFLVRLDNLWTTPASWIAFPLPSILRPDFTWPRRICTRILWGIIHKFLYSFFSRNYCSWFGLLFDANIIQLPFGLVMEWTDRTSVEEVTISCGEHLDAPNGRRFSILIIRLPGVSLENSNDTLKAFYNYLFTPASAHAFESDAEYQKTLSRAKRLQNPHHRIVFTHGDFKAHNVLVGDDGHLSGFLDWESAGWYPEYWEFTTAMRFGKDSWWFQLTSWMGGRQYLDELDSDVALNLLTVDSYIAL